LLIDVAESDFALRQRASGSLFGIGSSIASSIASNDARLPPCYALAGVECGLLPFRYTFRVATFAGASKENPSWLLEASEFCRSAGIKIMAWGPDLLTFEAKSPDRAWEIATKLAQFGFKTIKNRISANA
jgi:hypothetical protein